MLKGLLGGKKSADILVIGVVAYIGFSFMKNIKNGFAPKQVAKTTI